VTSRLTLLAIVLFSALLSALVPSEAEGQAAPDLKTNIDRLAAFDYPTRTNAARVIRRAVPAEAVAALAQAARSHSDAFVRYRALVLLTSFNDPTTPDMMRGLLGDSNDRVREVAYRWLEQHPDPRLTPPLLAALNTEQAEFVRPALIRAVTAASATDAQVQRALIAEVGRGLDFFRSAVVEALGDYHAAFAAAPIAELARTEGPLQDDAVLALGRIGGAQAAATFKVLTNPPLDVIPALHAAQCLFEDACAMHLQVLTETARSVVAKPDVVRASIAAIGAVAARGDAVATTTLVTLATTGSEPVRRDATLAFAGLALRRSAFVIDWLARAPGDVQARAIDLLHEGFDSLEEDFAEEQFFATARAAYWKAADGSPDRTVTATLIDKLEF
jgi:HEAT repeat protein